MRRRRTLLAVVVALAAGISLGAPSVADAAVTPQASVAAVQGEIVVRAANGHVFAAETDQPGAFYDLGGRVISTPAVAFSTSTDTDYVVGLGTDHKLWIFDHDSGAWRHLVTGGGASCQYAPAVVATGTTLGVACTDLGSRHLLAATVSLPAFSQTPTVPALIDQGGISMAGPGLYFAAGELNAWVVSHTNGIGNVYARGLSDPVGQYTQVAAYCASQPGVTAPFRATGYYLGCQNGSTQAYGGQRQSLHYDTTGIHGLTGLIVGPVGVVSGPDRATYFATDPHGVVWRMDISPDSAPVWTRFGGKAEPGVGAAYTVLRST